MEKTVALLIFVLAAVAALPHQTIIRKLDSGPRHQYAQDSAGQLHLVDLWGTISDVAEAVRYNPDTQNVYHLFTRRNPLVSQVLVPQNDTLIWSSNFNATLKTVVLIHGWLATATTNFNRVLTPAFLEAEDVNVIVVDWCAGACTLNYVAAIRNTITSGEGVARFITWLNNATGADPTNYHVTGFSLGGQQAGVVGRNLGGVVDYISSLDPAGPGFEDNAHKFNATDGNYTEVIHTNVGVSGYVGPLGDVDFYPNGGVDMPGCATDGCDHDRRKNSKESRTDIARRALRMVRLACLGLCGRVCSQCYYYLAESLRTGGFTGRRCYDYQSALIGNCSSSVTLRMGGVAPKYGAQGVYYLTTAAAPPFSIW